MLSSKVRLCPKGPQRLCQPSQACLCFFIIAMISSILTTSPLTAQEKKVIVELDREQIYEGESTRYRVFLSNFDRPVEPDLAGFDAFQVQRVGTREASSTNIRIVNGRQQRVVQRGIIYEYVLTPKYSGDLLVPAPVVMVDGKQLPARSVSLSVVAAIEQDVVILEMTLSHNTVYPMQPFDVSLNVAVKPIPEPEGDHDPLSVQNPLVQLALPWAEDNALPAGIIAKVPGQRWLASMRSERGGFSINGRDSSSSLLGGFGGFFRDLPEGYMPPAKRVHRPTANGPRLEYWEYTFTRTFVAEKVGEFAFGPATVKGTFGIRVDTRGQLEGEPVYAFAKPLTIHVKDVPTEGRPDSYSGVVGRFEIGADLSPQQAKVGDPVTLTLWLRGQGTLENAMAPKLEGIEDFVKHFKVYEATEETQDDLRLFTYSLRPKNIETSEVPPIPISYFDVEQEKFVTLRTEPISIAVTRSDQLDNDEIAMSVPTVTDDTNIESRAEGIFANVTDLRELRNERVHPDRWFLTLGGLTGLFFVVALVTQRVQRLHSDTSLQRRRSATSDAKRRLHSAIAKLESGDPKDGAEGISEALIGLVADATDTSHGVLTSTNAVNKLRELKIDEDLLERFGEVMQSCDDARYGAVGSAMSELPSKSLHVLDDLARAMKGQRLLS
ncbi:MAG: BatD family protein [Planctomycetes bacterium]|nr:BatD family protein [Planctomycetota bacterium]